MEPLPGRDALLLLPWLPRTAAVLGPPGDWPDALAHWKVLHVPPCEAEVVIVTADRAARTLQTGPTQVLLVVGDRGQRRLERSGWQLRRWLVRRSGDGWQVGEGAWGWRGLAPRTNRLTVAVRGQAAGAPATLRTARAAMPPGVLDGPTALYVAADPRRRALLLPAAGRIVVKIERSLGASSRGSREQQALLDLSGFGVTGVPAPLGGDPQGAPAWSAEQRLPGEALAGLLAIGPRGRGIAALDRLARWLDDLAVRTRSEVAPHPLELPLRGRSREVVTALPDLVGSPSVFAHGDLASALNVLIDADGGPQIIDWETARAQAPPLLDLLPVLCLGLARANGHEAPTAQTRYVLALARGECEASAWLVSALQRHAARLGIPAESMGPLALLAWAYQASMRAVHDELVVAAGLSLTPWMSAAELILAGWSEDPALGSAWRALGSPA